MTLAAFFICQSPGGLPQKPLKTKQIASVQDKNRTESLESADYRGPLLLMRFTALRLAGSNSQYTEVVKHGKPTILAGESE